MRKVIVKWEIRDENGSWSRSYENQFEITGYFSALGEDFDRACELLELRALRYKLAVKELEDEKTKHKSDL